MMSHDASRPERPAAEGGDVLLTMLELSERRGWEADFLSDEAGREPAGEGTCAAEEGPGSESEPFHLKAEEGRDLLAYGRRVIEVHLAGGGSLEAEPEWLERHPVFRVPRAVFVTLRKQGQLRGCMGDLVSAKPLHAEVQRCAIEAAVGDPRFQPVTIDELAQLTLSISILEVPRQVKVDHPEDYLRVLRPHVDGVILIYQGRQSTFLPSVWKEIPDPREFLFRLSRKQGSGPECWREPGALIYRYGACEISEET